MATAGIFTLMVNTGQQDQLLLATGLLNRRLRDIENIRAGIPSIRDKTPTLVDIEKTHILFLHAFFKPFVAVGTEYQVSGPIEGKPDFGDDVDFSIPVFGDFFNDMVIRVVLTGLKVGPQSQQVRYCDYLGHRIIRFARFEVNGNFLDQYDYNVYNFHHAFHVQPNKEVAWKRCMAQEIPQAVYMPTTTTSSGLEYRQIQYVANGAQTPKTAHPYVEMWIPLLFWFNLDPRLSIPSVSIPYGQRKITIGINHVALLAQGLPTPDFTAPKLDIFDLYTNNIFINPEIHDIFIRRIGFSMIRVHKEQRVPVADFSQKLLVNELRWPIETIYFGVVVPLNLESMDNWYLYCNVVGHNIQFPTVDVSGNVVAQTTTWYERAPLITSINITVHDITIFPTTPATFYNAYVPLTYGSFNINSPYDVGMYMLNFCFYPGSYQPSGYINLSRTREFYIEYAVNPLIPLLPQMTSFSLVFIGIAINFLLISYGSAVLRYNI